MRAFTLAAFLLIALALSASASKAQDSATYTDTQAGYAIDYPAQAELSAGLDAALGFNTVFVNFPDDAGSLAGGEFAGLIITVFDNPERAPVDVFAGERFGLRRDAPGKVRGEWIGGMPALLANRPSPLAGEYAAAALLEGDGVIIRIGLFGGGIDGPIEPPTQHYDGFNRIVHSIRRVPRETPPAPSVVVDPNVEPPTASVFQMPFNVPVTTVYDEQYGVAVGNTAYGVRNLGLEHRRTCFGVDWPWLLHSGVDWFRADEQPQTPTDVVAVADGIVAYYEPAYGTYPGKVVIVRHRLSDGHDLYAMYAHLGPDVSVVQGQVVFRGQRIGSLLNQGDNTHLHFEMRWFLDGSAIYGGYGNCNGIVYGRGYTYRVPPDNFPSPGAGYVDPAAFIAANGEGFVYLPLVVREFPRREPACVEGQHLLLNSGFEDGPASAPWVQSRNGSSDLIQEDRPYSGAYSLWFGGRNLADEEALQSFVLPYYTEGITLTFQRYVTTEEVEPIAFDRLEVVIENAAGVEVTPRFLLDNTAADRERWVAETVVLDGLQPLGGQRLQLSLKMATDGALVTSVFVDEVTLATRCAP